MVQVIVIYKAQGSIFCIWRYLLSMIESMINYERVASITFWIIIEFSIFCLYVYSWITSLKLNIFGRHIHVQQYTKNIYVGSKKGIQRKFLCYVCVNCKTFVNKQVVNICIFVIKEKELYGYSGHILCNIKWK